MPVHRNREVEHLLSLVKLTPKTATIEQIKIAIRCLEGRRYVKDAEAEFIEKIK
jgi:hypothetical protein